MDQKILELVEKKKGVIFDLDGTMTNTEFLHAEALFITLKELQENGLLSKSFQLNSSKELNTNFHGMADDEVYFKLFGTSPPLDLETFYQKKAMYFSNLINSYSEKKSQLLTPGLIPFLHHLLKIGKITGTVTASNREIAEITWNFFGLGELFRIRISRNDTFFTKPNPSPYFLALRKLNLNQSEALIFEDSHTGTKAALDSGVTTIGITEFSGPDSTISVNSILNFL